ncbi:hypothetical protein C1645_826973 [Glomus cerebriforme]|uniref:Uncharacterized protein n=1 Tax=Glomus cerebriforme TaxID=658196 RepID=A0A397SPU4_9GLOM|nr:hypothetical protein C1645_826973 [Glomus cerebriforme]
MRVCLAEWKDIKIFRLMKTNIKLALGFPYIAISSLLTLAADLEELLQSDSSSRR